MTCGISHKNIYFFKKNHRYDCVDRSDEEHCSIAEREVETSSRSEEEERVNRIVGRKNPENVRK